MAKTMDDVKTVLKGLENDGQELLDAIDSAILHERNMGQGMVKDSKDKLDGANSKLELLNSALTGMGFKEGDKLEDFIAANAAKIKKADDTFNKMSDSEKSNALLLGRIDKLEKSGKESAERADANEKRFKTSKIKSILLSKMGKKIYSAGLRADNLIQTGVAVLSDDNETVQFKVDDKLLPLEEGLDKYYEESENKPELINNSKSGPGGGPGDSDDDDDGKKRMTQKDFEKLDPSERGKFIKDGGKIKN